ncbi:MAG: hypothetical protein R3A80_05885 [Bdellovibrionota bacterium]
MKQKKLLIAAGLLSLLLLFLKNYFSNTKVTTIPDSVEIEKKRLPSSSPQTAEDPKEASQVALPEIVSQQTPKDVPNGLDGRWSHLPNFEDDTYVDTQLLLDGHPLEGYIFKWRKDAGSISELVAGSMPRIERVSGAFPPEAEVRQIAKDAVGSEGDIISTKQVWNLNSERVLTPQAKVEVQTQSRNKRSSGHEYWFVSLNSGKIVKRVEADRN